jgi:hypothetical protein
MPELKMLNLSNNYLVETKEPQFDTLASNKITCLDLSYNKIETIQENAFNKLKNVEYLNLSQNLIEEITSSLFLNLSSLKDLDLSHNKLTTIRSHYFKIKESTLKSLDLRYNKIIKYEPNSFCFLMGYIVDNPGQNDKPISA